MQARVNSRRGRADAAKPMSPVTRGLARRGGASKGGSSDAAIARFIVLLMTARCAETPMSSPRASRAASSSFIHICCFAWSSFCFFASSAFWMRADSKALRASSLDCRFSASSAFPPGFASPPRPVVFASP